MWMDTHTSTCAAIRPMQCTSAIGVRRAAHANMRIFSRSFTARHAKSDETIANELRGKMLPITEIASNLGIPSDVLEVCFVPIYGSRRSMLRKFARINLGSHLSPPFFRLFRLVRAQTSFPLHLTPPAPAAFFRQALWSLQGQAPAKLREQFGQGRW